MTTNLSHAGRVPVLLLSAMGALAAFLISGSAASASEDCITAQVGSAFRLPDGLLRSAGALTLCDTRTFSPVADQHVILVDGLPVGIFLSVKRSTEAGPGASPEIVFERGTDGHLDLVGYILPRAGRTMAYWLGARRETATKVGGGRVAGIAPPVAAIVAAQTR